ncbi:MAG: hypothetical protein HFJ09_12185 [Lachnospiraceae bacterium]|nr:hypothetical protein [Lachnospiraceae bacterium]
MKNILNQIVVTIAIQYYMKILNKIKDDEHASDYLYDHSLVLRDQTHDKHIYHFPRNIDINILYSIPIIRILAGKENEKYISFKKLKELLSYDIEQSKAEFDAIKTLIVHKQKHDSQFLIIMYHYPSGKWLLLDGRHRFVEYEKFKPDEERVPVLVVDSEMLLTAIINKSGFIAYCIQHNIYVLQKYPIWMWRTKLLNTHRFL